MNNQTNFTINYGFNINQIGVYKAGLADKTDIVDWALLDYLTGWELNADKTLTLTENGKTYVWIDYNHLLRVNPLLPEKKNSLSDRLKKLISLGLLESVKKEDKVFLRTTDLVWKIKMDTFWDTAGTPQTERSNQNE